MEKNTINLSIDDYNKMRDFNEAIKKNHCIKVYWKWDGYYDEIYSTDEMIENLAQTNVKLEEKIRELRNPKKQELTIEEIKKMNWWQFRKWKRSSKL